MSTPRFPLLRQGQGTTCTLTLPVGDGITDVISYISQLDLDGIDNFRSLIHNNFHR